MSKHAIFIPLVCRRELLRVHIVVWRGSKGGLEGHVARTGNSPGRGGQRVGVRLVVVRVVVKVKVDGSPAQRPVVRPGSARQGGTRRRAGKEREREKPQERPLRDQKGTQA
eukprot:1194449-Prorocentrum_minimum.AAC.3